MAKETNSEKGVGAEQSTEVPVCIGCFRPVDPLAHYCPNCGAATGQLTHYLPFVNIRWQASVWGQAWRQVGYRDVSIRGRLFRLLMVVWNAPIMLVGLLFRSSGKPEDIADLDDSVDRSDH